MSSADTGDQIVVDLQHPTSTSTTKSEPLLNGGQPEAGPSTRRRTRTSDVHVDSTTNAPKVEVDMKERTYIQPDHFYPTTNHPNHSGLARNIPKIGDGPLSPEDDPQALRGIPVFKPTMEEFQDFEAYATATTEWGKYSGIVKIIPPEEWTSSLPPISKTTLSKQTIRAPIQQNIFGSSGLFRIANVPRNKNRPLSVKEWFNKTQDKKFAGIGPKDIGKTLNRDSKEAIEWRARKNAEIKQAKEEKKRKNQEKKARKQAAAASSHLEDNQQDQRQASNGNNQADDDQHADPNDPSSTVPPLDPSSTSSHSSPDPANPTTPEAESESEPVEPWYKSFSPSQDWLPQDTNPEDYTPEACAALERHLWKNLGLGEPSWYGADMEGSLFVDEKTPWNVAHLPNLLNRWDLRHLPGVNAPYLYFGMWGASFAWHVEDMDLFSINYIHFGAPKYWYAVPQLQAEKFERVLQGYFPEESRHCDQYLRHKSFAVSPHRLANDGVHVNMLVHNQGEFVITYPRGYHAGFNMGFNCAESVNFALDSWVELGRRAKACRCVTHSVHIDVDEMIAKEEKRMNGEQELLEAIAEERQNKKPRKRAHAEPSETPRKRVKREVEIATAEGDETINTDEEGEMIDAIPTLPIMRKKKPKAVIDLSPTKPALQSSIIMENPVYPCLFCPSLNSDGLLPVLEPSNAIKNIWKPRTEEIKIHHQCALAMPGVGIEDRETDGKVVTYVVGLENIEQARWNLKCAACVDKRLAKTGAKIQCTQGKCPRAYHVSCAKEHDATSLKIWEVEIPVFPAEGEEPLPEGVPVPIAKDIKVELLCPQHNPDNKAQLEAKKANKIRNKVMSISIGSKVKIKVKNVALEFTLVELRESSQEIVVQDDLGQRAIYSWSTIDFRSSAVVKTENEYARVHTHTRKASDLPSAEPTPTIASTEHTGQSRTVPAQTSGVTLRFTVPTNTAKAKHPVPQTITQQPAAQFAPLRMDQMLNPSNDTPSRVVLCEDPRTSAIPKNGHLFDNNTRSRPQPAAHRQIPQMNVHHALNPPSTTTRYHPTQPTYDQASHIRPYDSTDPYNRPLPPLDRGYHSQQPLPVLPEIRRSSLSAQPPPLRVPNGFHVSSHVGYHSQPPRSAPARSYAAPPDQANGTYLPPLTNVQSTFQQGFTGHTNPNIPNHSSVNGVGKIDLGLQRMHSLMSHLRPLTVPAIHLAGTNGKGSVSAILESCLMTGSMNVGRYNSPHLIEPRDAIRINGQPPSRQTYNDTIRLIESINHQFNIQATTFEISTAAAYQILNTLQPPLDIMIIECGMGGARDATNIIPDEIKLISGLTSVGLDHTSFLGNTIYEISSEKSQIVSNGGILVISPQANKDTYSAAQQIAQHKNARIIESIKSDEIPRQTPPMTLKPFTRPTPRLVKTILPHSSPDGNRTKRRSMKVLETELNLGGSHQLDNLSLALTVLDILRNDHKSLQLQPKLISMTDQILQIGVRQADWPGRCSWLTYQNNLTLLVDGSHNYDSSTSLRSYIDNLNIHPQPRTHSKGRPKLRYIISLSSSPGKSIESVISPLLDARHPSDDVEVILWEFSTPIEGMPWINPIPTQQIYEVAKKFVKEENIKFGGKGLKGLQSLFHQLIMDEQRGAEDRLNVVCGSLYGVADVYRLLM